MVMNLVIAWCLLSVPFGVVMGMCIRYGVHGSGQRIAAAPSPGTTAPAGAPEARLGEPEPVDVPAQRQQRVGRGALQDAS